MQGIKKLQAMFLTMAIVFGFLAAIPQFAAGALDDETPPDNFDVVPRPSGEAYSSASRNESAAMETMAINYIVADIEQVSIPIKTSVNTNDFMSYNWASVSPVSQFIDNNGNIGFAYEDKNNIHIEKTDGNMNRTATLTIAKQYPLLGTVTCDDEGYYYIVWGQNDNAGSGGVETIAVSKYDNNGTFIKTAAIVSSNDSGLDHINTRYPFHYGNCAVAINNGILVCSYARSMYNGHQSNAIIAVNTDDMSLRTDIHAYTSHSFDQRVIYHKGLDRFVFADHGDAYPRGFNISWRDRYMRSMSPFTFYEEPHYWNNMYLLNRTNAHLGGIGEVGAGLALVASSAKSFSPAFMDEYRQLFIQIFDPLTETFITSGIRTDTNGNIIDTGVMWLTDYANASAENPQMVVSNDDNVIIMWEKYDKNKRFECSYFMVVSAAGEVIHEATPIEKTRLNAFEEPYIIGDHVYWITANGTTATVNKMGLEPIVNPIYTFVNRLYNNVLGRTPDNEGLDDWVQRLSSGKVSGAEIAFGFYFSTEFLTKQEVTDEDFVRNLYLTILGRTYDPETNDTEGWNHWITQLSNGASRVSVLAGFIDSTEYKGLCEKAGILPGKPAPQQDEAIRAFVWRLYTTALGRQPVNDSVGLEHWFDKLKSKQMSGSAVAYQLFFDPEGKEYADRNRTDEQYMEDLYKAVMGRSAQDDPDSAIQLARITTGGWTWMDLFNDFKKSPEFAGICNEYGIKP